MLPLWTHEEERQKAAWEKEAVAIVEAERSYTEQIRKIRDETRRELDSPPDPQSETTGKISDVGTFVTDLLQKNDEGFLHVYLERYWNSLVICISTI